MDSQRLSLTPSVARQTPRTDFGTVLQQTLRQASQLTGTVLGALPGGGLLSAAVSQVSALAAGGAPPAAAAALPTGSLAAASGGGGGAADLGGYLDQMRQEADRSLAMQMQLQQESREYNALSNVLKVRHDSAKAAINNLR